MASLRGGGGPAPITSSAYYRPGSAGATHSGYPRRSSAYRGDFLRNIMNRARGVRQAQAMGAARTPARPQPQYMPAPRQPTLSKSRGFDQQAQNQDDWRRAMLYAQGLVGGNTRSAARMDPFGIQNLAKQIYAMGPERAHAGMMQSGRLFGSQSGSPAPSPPESSYAGAGSGELEISNPMSSMERFFPFAARAEQEANLSSQYGVPINIGSGGAIPGSPGYEKGTMPGTVPKTGPALIHKGEAVVPAEQVDSQLMKYLVKDAKEKGIPLGNPGGNAYGCGSLRKYQGGTLNLGGQTPPAGPHVYRGEQPSGAPASKPMTMGGDATDWDTFTQVAQKHNLGQEYIDQVMGDFMSYVGPNRQKLGAQEAGNAWYSQPNRAFVKTMSELGKSGWKYGQGGGATPTPGTPPPQPPPAGGSNDFFVPDASTISGSFGGAGKAGLKDANLSEAQGGTMGFEKGSLGMPSYQGGSYGGEAGIAAYYELLDRLGRSLKGMSPVSPAFGPEDVQMVPTGPTTYEMGDPTKFQHMSSGVAPTRPPAAGELAARRAGAPPPSGMLPAGTTEPAGLLGPGRTFEAPAAGAIPAARQLGSGQLQLNPGDVVKAVEEAAPGDAPKILKATEEFLQKGKPVSDDVVKIMNKTPGGKKLALVIGGGIAAGAMAGSLSEKDYSALEKGLALTLVAPTLQELTKSIAGGEGVGRGIGRGIGKTLGPIADMWKDLMGGLAGAGRGTVEELMGKDYFRDVPAMADAAYQRNMEGLATPETAAAAMTPPSAEEPAPEFDPGMGTPEDPFKVPEQPGTERDRAYEELRDIPEQRRAQHFAGMAQARMTNLLTTLSTAKQGMDPEIRQNLEKQVSIAKSERDRWQGEAREREKEIEAELKAGIDLVQSVEKYRQQQELMGERQLKVEEAKTDRAVQIMNRRELGTSLRQTYAGLRATNPSTKRIAREQLVRLLTTAAQMRGGEVDLEEVNDIAELMQGVPEPLFYDAIDKILADLKEGEEQ